MVGSSSPAGHDFSSALPRLRAAVLAAKQHDRMAPVTVLAPSNIAGIAARRYLAAQGDGIAGVRVSTLSRFAETIAAPILAPRRPATGPILTAAWRAALTADPGPFRDIADHPSTARGLAVAHRELRDLTPSALDAIAAVTPVSRDIVRLHRQVQAALAPGWYDTTDMLVTAADHLPHDLGHCVLYLPQPLNRAEQRLVTALSGADGVPVDLVLGLTGVRRADTAVHLTVPRAPGHVDDHPHPPSATRVLNASDSDDEVRCVVREVVRVLATTPAHRIAVLYSNVTPYGRLLHEQLAQADVVVNGPGVRAADERAIPRTLTELLALDGLPRGDLFQALANAPVFDPAGGRVPVARWERISRSAGVVAGADWDTRLDAYVVDREQTARAEQASDTPRPWLVERCAREAAEARALQAFAGWLRGELDRARTITTWAGLAGWLSDLVATLFRIDAPALPPEERYAAAAITTIIGRLDGLDALAPATDLELLREVLAVELAAVLPRVGRFGEGVFVAPLSAAVGLDVDVVFVCGLSEDLYPGRPAADALLTPRVREASGGELPAAAERIHTRHRNLLAAFAAARVEAVASFARGDLRRSTSRLPCRFLLPSLRQLSRRNGLAATEWSDADLDYDGRMATAGSFAGELQRTPALATEQEWRTRAAAVAGGLDDDRVDAALAMIQARASDRLTRFDGFIGAEEELPNYAAGEQSVAPTMLESYADCPHAFFVQRLLRVERLEQPEDIVAISAMDIGNIVHETVDRLVTEFADALPGYGEPWSAAQRARAVEIVDDIAHEYEQRGLTGHPRLWTGERARIVDDVRWLLDDDDAWRATVGARVAASELPFGRQGVPPVAIPLADGRILMRGSADKVDVGRDGTIYVTDIKTGSRRRFTDIKQENPVVGGTKLQLPVYAYAARARFGDDTTPVQTAYWFVRRDRGRLTLTLTPTLAQVYADTVGTLVAGIAGGLFPLRPPDDDDYAFVQCVYCNPDGIDYVEARARWARKQHDPRLQALISLSGGTGPA